MLAYQRWGKNETPESTHMKGDFLVGKYYTKFAEEAEVNPKLEEEAQQLLVEWEKYNPEVRKLWKKMNEWALKGMNETFSKFGTHFDKEYFESQFYDKAKEVVQEGLEKGIFIQAENGAIIAPLKDKNLPDKALLRGDGTTIYITQDIFLALQRFREFPGLTKIVYVVASEQDLHFKQLFAILEKMKIPQAKQCYHLSYGLVNLPEGKMKTRSGNVVELDDIIKELSQLALTELRKRYPELPENELARRAKVIGLAALKLYLLKIDSRKDLHFIPEESISFEGQTGPYLLYTLARTNSLLIKATQALSVNECELLNEPKESEIIHLLAKKEEIFSHSLRNYSPHTLVQFLLELTNAFNSYYHETKVIQGDIPLQKARLALVKAVNCVVEEGLFCLGIETLKEM
jgi:arginyl-tRNA synthetase